MNPTVLNKEENLNNEILDWGGESILTGDVNLDNEYAQEIFDLEELRNLRKEYNTKLTNI